MPPRLATLFFAFGIAWLFASDRPLMAKVSKAVWIPVVWLLIGGSRNVGEWLQLRSPMDQNARYMEGSPLDRAFLGALIILGLLVILSRQKQLVSILRANPAVVLYFLYCGTSSIWSDYPDVSFKRWIRAVGDVVMVLVILTEAEWQGALKRVLARVGYMLLPLSVLLIRYYPDLGRGYNIAGSAMYWTGVTTDKNGLGMICLIFGLGGLWRFLELYQMPKSPQRTRPLIARGALVIITLWLLWESNSMTSISCFVMGATLMIVTGRWPSFRKPRMVALLASAAVGVSAFVLFGGAGSVLELLGRNPTLTGRTEVWGIVLPFAQSPLLGCGYESFWLGERLERIGAMTSSGINEAHNGYLEIYLNLGWMGLSFLGLVIISGFRKVVTILREDPAVGKLMLAYYVLALIYNFTEAGYKMQNPVWIFFLLAVMAGSKAAVQEPVPIPWANARRKLRELGPRKEYALDPR